jgi:pimeloyl-ACP methyl ester carboxylesterase
MYLNNYLRNILTLFLLTGSLLLKAQVEYPYPVKKLTATIENKPVNVAYMDVSPGRIGLEDYKRFVPYQPLEKLFNKEKSATYESYKKYQQTYYPLWKQEYEQYVQAQAEALTDPGFINIAWANAVTYQMIYEQPVCYEWDRIKVPTLLIIGQQDRTVVGKDQLPESEKNKYGQYLQLAATTQKQIPDCRMVELPGIGHIPHIQDLAQFQEHVLKFIKI